MAILSISIRSLVIVFLVSQDSSMATWERIGKKCVKIFKTLKSFQMSATSCQNNNAQLFIIENQTQLDFFTKLISKANIYIGLEKDGNGKWKWINGSEFVNTAWWLKNHPGIGTCAFVREGKLYGSLPGNTRWYSCERKSSYSATTLKMTVSTSELCGVEIMPNCDGLPCIDVCYLHADCTIYATMANLCINMKNITDVNSCAINVRPSLKIYSLMVTC